MNFKFSFILLSIITVFSLIGCSNNEKTMAHSEMDHSEMDHSEMDHSEMDHSEMDHSEMDHSEMDHSEMDHSDKPIPSAINEQEVHQQEVSQSISKWHEKSIKGATVKIAVLDTGIDLTHTDVKIVKGVNFVGNTKDDFQDDNGHGTKIAGIIGARENNKLLLGVAPESELYIAKVGDLNGNVYHEDLVEGIQWATEQNVDIINISLEFPTKTNQLENAIKRAHKNGIIIISSSGNIKYPGDVDKSYPGNFDEVISVGMLNTDGEIYTKEFKEKKVDVFAPGEDIFSLYFDNKMTLDTGVSFATAYASGYAALVIQDFKNNSHQYDYQTVKKALKQNLEIKM